MKTFITCGFGDFANQLTQHDYKTFHFDKADQIKQEILFKSHFVVLAFYEPRLNEKRLNEILAFQFYFREAHIIIVSDPKYMDFTKHYRDHAFLFFFAIDEIAQIRSLFKRFDKELISIKRGNVRVKIELDAELKTQSLLSIFPMKKSESLGFKAWIYDISNTGVSVIVKNQNLAEGQFISLYIVMPDQSTTKVEGQVKWKQPSQTGTSKVGIQMVNPINLIALITRDSQVLRKPKVSGAKKSA